MGANPRDLAPVEDDIEGRAQEVGSMGNDNTRPAGGDLRHTAQELLGRRAGQAGLGFVEDEHAGVAEEQARQHQAALFAAGESGRHGAHLGREAARSFGVGELAEVDAAERLAHGRGVGRGGEAEREVLLHAAFEQA